MKVIFVAIIMSMSIACPSKSHHINHGNYFKYAGCWKSNHYHIDYHSCNICDNIINYYFSDGYEIIVIKTHHYLSHHAKKILKRKYQKHLGFYKNRVKFRFVV